MLFADAIVGEVGGWIGFAGGVLGILSAAVSGYFGYAAARDKLRYDATVIELKAENRRLAEAEQECRRDHKALEERFARLETKLEAERERAVEERAKLETKVQEQRDMKHELNGRLATIQAQLQLQGISLDIKPIKGDGSGTMPKPPGPPSESKNPF